MTTWTYDGVDLETFGHITLLDDYLDTVPQRGDNQIIPNRHGSIYVEKYYDEKTLSVGIAIRKDSAILLEEALDQMKKLFSHGQKTLSNTRADGSVRTALAAMEGQLQLKRESYKFCRVVVTFKLASPFFRGAVAVDETVTVNASSVDMDVDNVGTAPEIDPVIVLTGPLDDVVITNTTNGSILEYTASIPSPRVVTISNVNGEYIAVNDLMANVINNVEHSGSPALLALESGVNELTVESSVTTTGTVRIWFYPPFL